jgi:endonuclease YncB( thermonuclease family)
VTALFFQLLSLAALTATSLLPAQTNTTTITEPAELIQLRKQYAVRALAASRTLAEQYTKALAVLEKEGGEAGDYEIALAAQTRRVELTGLYSTQLEDTALSNIIVLKPADAKLGGNVSYDKSVNALVNWRAVGNTASWDLAAVPVPAGGADMGEMPTRITTQFIPDLLTGGEFEFYEDSNLSGASQNRRTAQVTTTGGWGTLATLQLGSFQLGRTTARLTLRIARVRGSGGVMHLKEIRLSPAKPASSTPPVEPLADGSTPPVGDELVLLQQAHQDKLRQVATPVLTAYVGQIRNLAGEAAAKNQTDATEELQAEEQRFLKLVQNTSTISELNKLMAGSKKLIQEDVEEWRDAKYVVREDNAGDRFVLNHNGEFFPVHLIGVACPLPKETAVEDLKRHAKYFGITEKDALQLGLQAKEFTSSFLTGKNLLVQTRGLRDKEGLLLVSVHPEGVGDFAGVLVDNGLAAVTQTRQKSRGSDALYTALKERETAARTRAIPPGGWAMSQDTPEATAAK